VPIEDLQLYLTTTCPAHCAHCATRSGPGRDHTLFPHEIVRVVSAIQEVPVRRMTISGGEPFLRPPLLHTAVSAAARVAPVRVLTSASWAAEPAAARAKLVLLQEAGLHTLSISVDGFHQAHVPLVRAATVIQAARDVGIPDITIESCFIVPEQPNGFFDHRTEQVLAELATLCELDGIPVRRRRAKFIGRAADQLSPFLPTQPVAALHCPLLEDPDPVSSVSVFPGGWVTVCPGIAIGNLRWQTLQEILANWRAHPVLRALHSEGFAGLTRLAREHGVQPAGCYVSGCHLCYQIRQGLRPHMLDHLAPGTVYAEGALTPVLRLENAIVYGPVKSHRLGRSLGINLLPTDRKVCSFDCIYCHYGRTTEHTLNPDLAGFPSIDEVLAAVETSLRDAADAGLHAAHNLDTITFSGNGEPTLHPWFPAIAAGVRQLRDTLAPGVKLAVFSNTTTASRPEIRQALALFDAAILKLDAGDPESFEMINRPVAGIELAGIVKSLQDLPQLVVQSLLLDGDVPNARGEPLEAWMCMLGKIRPASVQITSTHWPVPETGIERVAIQRLTSIADEIRSRILAPHPPSAPICRRTCVYTYGR